MKTQKTRRLGRLKQGATVGTVVIALGMSAAAEAAQTPTTGSVTHVVDGDTLDVQLAAGGAVRVRLIGIDTPEIGECGYDQASAHMASIAAGRSVTLVGDPTQDAIDRYGRSLYYVDRDDGLDLGLEMIRAGLAEVYVYDANFQRRLGPYVEAETNAITADRGVWGSCDGVHSPPREQPSEADLREAAAVAFVRRYYRRVSNDKFQTHGTRRPNASAARSDRSVRGGPAMLALSESRS